MHPLSQIFHFDVDWIPQVRNHDTMFKCMEYDDKIIFINILLYSLPLGNMLSFSLFFINMVCVIIDFLM